MDYLQEGIGLRAMAQRDPLVEYQREGFDMFAAMMDGIQEESVGFLFNLEVEVEEPAAQPAPSLEAAAQESAGADTVTTDEPQLDTSLLDAAQAAHEQAAAPQISAKGLDRNTAQQPMTYSAPELGSDSPSVQHSAPAASSESKTAKRQQARTNPNKGSRGSKSGKSGGKRKK
jgi:preprotein translocase subunit SecA